MGDRLVGLRRSTGALPFREAGLYEYVWEGRGGGHTLNSHYSV